MGSLLRTLLVASSLVACGAHNTAPKPVVASLVPGTEGQPGPKGDTGATGPQGPKGGTGAQGVQGPKGDSAPALSQNEWVDPETGLVWVHGGADTTYSASACVSPFTVPTKQQLNDARLHGIFTVFGTDTVAWYASTVGDADYVAAHGLTSSGATPTALISYTYFCVKS